MDLDEIAGLNEGHFGLSRHCGISKVAAAAKITAVILGIEDLPSRRHCRVAVSFPLVVVVLHAGDVEVSFCGVSRLLSATLRAITTSGSG